MQHATEPRGKVYCSECHILIAPYAKKSADGTMHRECEQKLQHAAAQVAPRLTASVH